MDTQQEIQTYGATAVFLTLSALLIAGLLLISHSANAEPTRHELCKSISESAEYMMQLRQNGRSMSSMMDHFQDSEMAKQIVTAAYNEPRYRTDENKKRAKQEFANKVYSECIEFGSQ